MTRMSSGAPLGMVSRYDDGFSSCVRVAVITVEVVVVVDMDIVDVLLEELELDFMGNVERINETKDEEVTMDIIV